MGHCRFLAILSVILTSASFCEASGSKCPLPWNNDSSLPLGMNTSAVCPYGRLLPGDVTLPNDATFVDRICVVYGYIPYVVIAVAFVDALIRAVFRFGFGTRELVFLLFVGVQVGLSELVFKKMVQQARPDRSCNLSCGMPSSHATMSIGFFMLMFLDASYRVMPSYPLDVDTAMFYKKSLRNRASLCGFSLHDSIVGICRAFINVAPLPNQPTLNSWDFITFVLYWGLLLVPVPFTRVVLFDHSPAQVMVGATIGIIEAVVYHALLRMVLRKTNHLLGQRVGGCLIHNFGLPLYETISTSCNLLAGAKEALAEGTEYDDDDWQELLTMPAQFNWYLKNIDPLVNAVEFDEDHPHVVSKRSILKKLKRQSIEAVKLIDAQAAYDLEEADHEEDVDEDEE